MMGDDVKSDNDPFPVKLYDLLENTDPRVVSWQPDGNGFTIHDPHNMCAKVLPRFFRHDRMTSLQRQLDLYGFRRVVTGNETGAYRHTLFFRGRPDLLTGIRRQKARKPSNKPPSSGDAAAEGNASAATARSGGGARGGIACASSGGGGNNDGTSRTTGRCGGAGVSAEDSTHGQRSMKPRDDIDDEVHREAGCATAAPPHLRHDDEVARAPHSPPLEAPNTLPRQQADAVQYSPLIFYCPSPSCLTFIKFDRNPHRANTPTSQRVSAPNSWFASRVPAAPPIRRLHASLVLVDAVDGGGGDDDDDVAGHPSREPSRRIVPPPPARRRAVAVAQRFIRRRRRCPVVQAAARPRRVGAAAAV